jgi:hypothetical protein
MLMFRQKSIIFSIGLFSSKSIKNGKAKRLSGNQRIITAFLIINILMFFLGSKLLCQIISLPRASWINEGIIDAGGSLGCRWISLDSPSCVIAIVSHSAIHPVLIIKDIKTISRKF